MTISPRQLKALYKQGNNISTLLREEKNLTLNTEQIIEIAYDLQTGSYIEAMNNAEMAAFKKEYSSELANTIQTLCTPLSVMEAGVGEATTLSGVLQILNTQVTSFGFDLSWSRIVYAKQWLQSQGLHHSTLCTGSLFHIPFANNSIDVVYTSHSIEPNGGNEECILRELYRVTKKFLILLEPGYEFASDKAKQRMDFHGYCKNLKPLAEELGYEVLEHKPFLVSPSPLNPTAITIIKKKQVNEPSSHILACPRFTTPLEDLEGMLYSPEALSVYPILGGIPCLRIENAIFASQYKEVINAKVVLNSKS